MNSKAAIKILVLVVAAYFASVGFGVYRITSSEVFPLAKQGLAAYLKGSNSKAANEESYFKWWRAWFFREDKVQFFLCSQSGSCHAIIGYKAEGQWVINVDGNRISVDGKLFRIDQWKIN